MKAIGRWAVAFLAVIAGFTVPAWACGALILRDVFTDPGVRWLVATAAGLAVATFVGLWAYGFVTGSEEEESREHGAAADDGTPSARSRTGRGRVKNSIKGGFFLGNVIQGRDIDYHPAPPPSEPGEP